jgi:hypothetical protein
LTISKHTCKNLMGRSRMVFHFRLNLLQTCKPLLRNESKNSPSMIAYGGILTITALFRSPICCSPNEKAK